jgi:hypothetical protein
MPTFVSEKMCELINSGRQTYKGFKEGHLTKSVNVLFEHYGAEVTSTQVHNHLSKWKVRWLTLAGLEISSSVVLTRFLMSY